MPCFTQPNLSEIQKQNRRKAVERLRGFLAAGTVQVVIGRNGALAFKGWTAEQRQGVADVCAYRQIANTPEMRRAVMRAEAMSGAKLNLQAVAAGVHSHDEGATWNPGH